MVEYIHRPRGRFNIAFTVYMSLTTYFNDMKIELAKVTWPTRTQVINYTIGVVVISLVVAYVLGFFDYVFSLGLTHLLGL